MTPNHKELLPCPFCGSKVGISYCGTGTYEIYSDNKECLICGDGLLINHGGIVSTDINEVIKVWNNRAKGMVEKEEHYKKVEGYAFPQYPLSVFLRTQPFLTPLQADLLAERICLKFTDAPKEGSTCDREVKPCPIHEEGETPNDIAWQQGYKAGAIHEAHLQWVIDNKNKEIAKLYELLNKAKLSAKPELVPLDRLKVGAIFASFGLRSCQISSDKWIDFISDFTEQFCDQFGTNPDEVTK